MEQASRWAPLGSFRRVAGKGSCRLQILRAPRPTWRAITTCRAALGPADRRLLVCSTPHLPTVVCRSRRQRLSGAAIVRPGVCRLRREFAQMLICVYAVLFTFDIQLVTNVVWGAFHVVSALTPAPEKTTLTRLLVLFYNIRLKTRPCVLQGQQSKGEPGWLSRVGGPHFEEGLKRSTGSQKHRISPVSIDMVPLGGCGVVPARSGGTMRQAEAHGV
ncbi:hypothetical protein NDU88_002037 [Pleurodeles waltl]|uniref:Uncharacterized protein n=1 Tax=Pleurodeles waltl TaxID=8319 RepID=A0AAV7T243_PLEWA|nr:hypothetical protein NDU88_002037 [Pleurodeles waltl]